MDNNEEIMIGESAGDESERKDKRREGIYDWIEVFTAAVTIVVIMLSFIMRIATVRGHSMDNTLSDGQVLIMSDMFYTPKQGDIIVVQQNGGYFESPLVKRVIATGGQKLHIDFTNWEVTVDGKVIDEEYVKRGIPGVSMDKEEYYSVYSSYFDETGSITIPEGYLFVMGDNRNESSDSRSIYVGLVRENEVLGKVVFSLLPLSKLGVVKSAG